MLRKPPTANRLPAASRRHLFADALERRCARKAGHDAVPAAGGAGLDAKQRDFTAAAQGVAAAHVSAIFAAAGPRARAAAEQGRLLAGAAAEQAIVTAGARRGA